MLDLCLLGLEAALLRLASGHQVGVVALAGALHSARSRVILEQGGGNDIYSGSGCLLWEMNEASLRWEE